MFALMKPARKKGFTKIQNFSNATIKILSMEWSYWSSLGEVEQPSEKIFEEVDKVVFLGQVICLSIQHLDP